MSGRLAVHRHEARLNSVFQRAATVADVEIQADLAKHLCVLVSGYLETSIYEMLRYYTGRRSSEQVLAYVDSQLQWFMNAKTGKILDLFGSFDADWRKRLETFLVDERKAAIDSTVDLRNQIAHGEWTGISLVRVSSYYATIKLVVREIEDICDPQ